MIYLDCETNKAVTKLWCVVTIKDDRLPELWDDSDNWRDLKEYLQGQDVCAHNGIGFDKDVIDKFVGDTQSHWTDTLILSRLYNPQLTGGHSLAAWGERFGDAKIDFDDYDGEGVGTLYSWGEWWYKLTSYCAQDTRLLRRLHLHLMDKLNQWKNPEQSIELEHKVAHIMHQQTKTGFMLDEPHTVALLGTVQNRMAEIEIELQAKFPPIVTERYSAKTGKRLKDNVEIFNIGSRRQVAKRLASLGAVFNDYTTGGENYIELNNGKKPDQQTAIEKGYYRVDESTLSNIDLPEAQLCAEFLMLQKRDGMIRSWLDAMQSDGRVHGRVITNGAVTGRMTHSNPNMGQITSTKSAYGAESRQCWTVPEGYKLVGCDLSGIELRCLAHYMQDDDWTRELLEGDIHTKNQLAAGLDSRDQAKTMIYATLYGAGAVKIGSIVGAGRARGMQIMNDFYANTPALKALKDKVEGIAERHGIVPALDGRALQVRSTHSALNTLLQGAGAVVAKQWLVEIHKALTDLNLHSVARQVVMVHDEVQFEVKEEYAEDVAKVLSLAATRAGEVLGFRLPVEAESKIGNNWFDTH